MPFFMIIFTEFFLKLELLIELGILNEIFKDNIPEIRYMFKWNSNGGGNARVGGGTTSVREQTVFFTNETDL